MVYHSELMDRIDEWNEMPSTDSKGVKHQREMFIDLKQSRLIRKESNHHICSIVIALVKRLRE